MAKTFVWCEKELCQERDVTGHTVTKQFFTLGEQINGTNYFYTKDHLGNIREMTDSGGVVHANYDYDPFGRQTQLSGSLNADFGYTGFYMERTVGLDLTLFRAYDPNKGRWLNRDPLGESAGLNVFSYVGNETFSFRDVYGLDCSPCNPTPTPVKHPFSPWLPTSPMLPGPASPCQPPSPFMSWLFGAGLAHLGGDLFEGILFIDHDLVDFDFGPGSGNNANNYLPLTPKVNPNCPVTPKKSN